MSKISKGFTQKDKIRFKCVVESLDQLEDRSIHDLDTENILQDVLADLKKLHKKYPVNTYVGELICDYLVYGGDVSEVILILEKIKRATKNTDFYLMTGQIYLKESFLFMAKEDLDFYSDQSDGEELGEDFLEMYKQLSLECERISETIYENNDEIIQQQIENERGQLILRYGNLKDGLNHFLKLTGKDPHFIPIENNLGLCYLQMAKFHEAWDQFLKVMELEPDNAFALGQLARVLFYLGEMDKLRECLFKLEQIRERNIGIYYDLINIHALLGNHNEIIRLFSDFDEECNLSRNNTESSAIYFYGGSAFLMAGRMPEGIRVLKKINENKTIYSKLASLNLEDAEKTVGDQNGPAYFTLHNLFPKSVMDSFLSMDSNSSTGWTKSILQKNHYLIKRMLPVVLDSGDDMIRTWYVNMYDFFPFQDFHDPLFQFMQGSKGTDELRSKLHAIFSSDESINTFNPLYIKGEKAQAKNFKITSEIRNYHYTPEQEALNSKAFTCLVDKNYESAVELWEVYIHKYPDDPTAINNLASAYEQLGQDDKRDALVTRLGNDFPDYFFYKIQKASSLISSEAFDEAKHILQE
nr:hypothetical protein [Spirochaetaceae bacterium]